MEVSSLLYAPTNLLLGIVSQVITR